MSRERRSESVGTRDVARVAWPIVTQMLAYQLMTTADTLFVARLGTSALAAVGLGLPFVFLARTFGNGLLNGMQIVTAQKVGAGERIGVRATGWQGLWIALMCILPAWSVVPGLGAMFRWMDVKDEVAAMGTDYVGLLLLAAPATLVGGALAFWFQGRGDTRTPMIAMVMGNFLNIALDPICIWGLGPVPALGIRGAAVATAISEVFVVGLLWWRWRLAWTEPEPWRPDRAILRRIWAVGAPLGLMQFLDLMVFAAMSFILARAGEVHLAAHTVVLRIASLSFLPGHAISSATGVLVGQAVGARRREGVEQAIRAGLTMAVAVMACFGVLFVVAPELLIGIFGVTPEVVVLGRQVLLVVAAFQIFDAVAMVMHHALSGAGDTRFVLGVSVAASWGLKLPIAWFCAISLGYGVVGAWLGFTGEILVLAAVLGLRVFRGGWHRAAWGEVSEMQEFVPDPVV